jgi:HK97 gp10 family phage protein
MASPRIRVRVEGNEELRRALNAFPETLRKGALRRGVEEAADEVLGQAEQNVPVDTGRLLGGLVAKPVRSRNPTRVAVNVQTGKDTFYGAFLEYGTSRMPARPWFRPALFQAGERAIGRAVAAVKRAMDVTGPLR